MSPHQTSHLCKFDIEPGQAFTLLLIIRNNAWRLPLEVWFSVSTGKIVPGMNGGTALKCQTLHIHSEAQTFTNWRNNCLTEGELSVPKADTF